MKRIQLLLILLLFTSLSFGCTSVKKVDVQVSPLFKSGNYQLQGIEGTIGILAPGGFIANKPNKYMWHFWGTKEELAQTPFKVEAVDLKTGKKQQVLLENMGTGNKKYVWGFDNLGGTNKQGDALQIPSGMEFSHAGKWSLNAYLGEKLFGSVVVDVSE
ncbi:hypothetical protein QFZ81_004014 [Paenibacillus sp. V4I9]|uniref:DUF4871 domain-containing protein n=1 Tax=Paenibacillus sp. V4I9 TaxID=3042308 RepID=UPI002782C9F9|nr:DUF4871 domain-containing protein [Paenibacillus sp. V4I9]MDQ0888926.1 hypothetical protein [Paenibacillus sp. V4I9]